MRLAITGKPNNYFGTWPCALCAETFELDDPAFSVYLDAEEIGDACPACAQASAERIRETLRRRAATLKGEAAAIAAKAAHLLQVAETAEIILPGQGGR